MTVPAPVLPASCRLLCLLLPQQELKSVGEHGVAMHPLLRKLECEEAYIAIDLAVIVQATELQSNRKKLLSVCLTPAYMQKAAKTA